MALLDFITSQKPQDVERRLRLAQAMSGMSLRPNVGLQQSIAGRLEDIKAQREKQVASDVLAKQSAMAQQLLGSKFPMLSGALKSGIISPKDAITAARQGADAKVVGKALVAPDGTVIYRDEAEGDDKTTAFNTLHQRAIAAGLKEGTPEYQNFMIQGGASKGMALTVAPDGTVTFAEGGAAPIKLTETQGKATGFYDRANKANQIIAQLESEGTNFGQALLGMVPFDAANWAKTPERQQYEQAKRDFINAVLRQESGAAIGKDEFTNADKQYFPQVGDSQAVVDQKRRNRETVANALKIVSGAGAGLLNPVEQAAAQTPATTQAATTIDQAISDLED